jgi:hypothetical protein
VELIATIKVALMTAPVEEGVTIGTGSVYAILDSQDRTAAKSRAQIFAPVATISLAMTSKPV